MYVVKVPRIKSKPSKHQKVHTGEKSYDYGNVRNPSLANPTAQCITDHTVGGGEFLSMWSM